MSISTLEVSVRGVRSPVLTAGSPDGAEAVVGQPPGVPAAAQPGEPAPDPRPDRRIHDTSRSWATKRAVLKLYHATPRPRWPDRPTLVIWGTQDAYLPCEQAERQRRAFPSARVELLDGHGHWVMLEDPGRVASLVIPFLTRQLSGGVTAAGSPASPPPSS